MDTFAKGLLVADEIISAGEFDQFVEERYSSYNSGIGKQIVEGAVGFEELEAYAMELEEVKNTSGRQELLENIFNSYIYRK
jgi:xylose isomerase